MTSPTVPLPPVADTGEEIPDHARIILTVETLVDGVRGYRTIAEEADLPEVAELMRKLGRRRQEAVSRLVQVSADAGVDIDVDVDGTASGGLHRAWIELEGKVAGDDALIGSAITGEKHALEECEKTLEAGLPEMIANAVRRAAEDIRAALDELEAFTSE